jgi:nitrate reductase beta subunit
MMYGGIQRNSWYNRLGATPKYYGNDVEHECGLEKEATMEDEGTWTVTFARANDGSGRRYL